MPMDRSLYPPNWNEIALKIKTEVDWECEWCGRPCRPPGVKLSDVETWLEENHPDWLPKLYDWEDTEEFGYIEVPKPQRFTLTVAHLNHKPEDCRRENLKALCSVCHCRYDVKAMATKKLLKMEREGQLSLDLLTHPEPAEQGKKSESGSATDQGEPMTCQHKIAMLLTQEIKAKAPAYQVKWNPVVKCWPDDPPGMFEVWADNYIHYRRRTEHGVRRLMEGRQ